MRLVHVTYCFAAIAGISAAGCKSAMPPKETPQNPAVKQAPSESYQKNTEDFTKKMLERGRDIFRFDTFGSEAFWGDTLRLHEAIAGEGHGGTGKGLTPRMALDVGLKVDFGAIPKSLLDVIKSGGLNFDDVKTTHDLLKHDAVVGVKAFYQDDKLVRVGITCAFCHSTVDDNFAKGIGRRLDGWPNRDLNVGAIAALAPNLQPVADWVGVDVATVKKVLTSWGPGRYDAELLIDGKAFRPDGGNASTMIPAAFGLLGVNLHTYTGWGSVTYWNAYVAITQMHGQGTFFDPRLDDEKKFPLAHKRKLGHLQPRDDKTTDKLAALHFYQLSLPAPTPPDDSYDKAAAARGKDLFETKAKCAQCHVPPLMVEPGWSMHTPDEIGIDDFQAKRSPDGRYRTTPLHGLFVRAKGGFYHDGRFKTLADVVDHYDRHLGLGLGAAEKTDLVEYLKSL